MEKKSRKILNVITIAVLAVTTAVTCYSTWLLYTYTGLKIAGIFFGVAMLLTAALFLLRKKVPWLIMILGIIYMAGILAIGYTGHKTEKTVARIEAKPEYETVQIAAFKDSGITSESDLSDYRLGYVSTDMNAYKRCSEILSENGKKVERTMPYKNAKRALRAMEDDRTQLILLTPMAKARLIEDDADFEDRIIILFEKKYVMEKVKAKPVDISKEPCVIYLQGADSSGASINSTGRGDSNILITLNPVTKKVNMQVIPRDTFVNIPSMGGRSKLSYSGWWGGIQSSIESIEEKFGIDINYYAKINFEGVTGLVDALGGVNVYSQYDFYCHGYHFTPGYNSVNGEQALAFVTERKSLPQNELSRGKNQMAMVKAIINKFAEDPNYDDAVAIVDGLSKSFVTNIPKRDYLKTFNVFVDLIPSLKEMKPKSMKGEFLWHTDEVSGEYKYYFYPADGEVERVRNDIEKIKSGK